MMAPYSSSVTITQLPALNCWCLDFGSSELGNMTLDQIILQLQNTLFFFLWKVLFEHIADSIKKVQPTKALYYFVQREKMLKIS